MEGGQDKNMGLKDTSYCVESKWATRIYCTAMGNITYFIIPLIALKSKKMNHCFVYQRLILYIHYTSIK